MKIAISILRWMIILFLFFFFIKLFSCGTSNNIGMCEEKKIKWFLYTYKFGISKYLIGHQNEVTSILFNAVTKKPNEILIPTDFINLFLIFFNSYNFIILLFFLMVWILYLFNDIINIRYILYFLFFIFLLYIYFKLSYKEPVLLLCEEKKTKLFWYTYKFGIMKYLVADQNEIGSIVYNSVTRKPNEILIPTGNINIKKGFDSVLFNISDGTLKGLQYKHKHIDMSILNEKQFYSMLRHTCASISHCDQLVVDTNSTNINVLHAKLNSSSYDNLRSLIKENKIIIYNSDQWLIDQNDEVIASSIKENNKAIETLILEKNLDAGDLVRQIHEVGDDPRFNELGNVSKGKLEQMRSFSISSLDRSYIDIHLKGIKIINETVANEILKIKK